MLRGRIRAAAPVGRSPARSDIDAPRTRDLWLRVGTPAERLQRGAAVNYSIVPGRNVDATQGRALGRRCSSERSLLTYAPLMDRSAVLRDARVPAAQSARPQRRHDEDRPATTWPSAVELRLRRSARLRPRRAVRRRQRPAAAAADADVRPHHRDLARPAARTARASRAPSSTCGRDLWFFACHFKGDPVMPGCLGLDALWQLTGFFLGWLGAPGRGRALGVGEVKFSGMVLPTVKTVEYGVDLKRVIRRKLMLGIADGWLKADGEAIYTAKDLRVGLFKTRASAEQPRDSALIAMLAGTPSAGHAVGKEERGAHEARRRHRHGHRLLDRQQHPGSAGLAARGASPASSRAENYAELGFRCQVHGAPTLDSETHGRPRAPCASWRRHGLELRRHGPGDPRRRPRGRRRLQRAHRHHHGLRRALDPRHRRGRRHRRATKGPKRVGPFAVPKAMCSTASATLATWFKIKGVNYSISSACATSATASATPTS